MGAVACVFGEGGRVGVDGVAAKFAAEEVGDEGGGGDTSERAVSGAVVLGEGRGGGEEEWSGAGAELGFLVNSETGHSEDQQPNYVGLSC